MQRRRLALAAAGPFALALALSAARAKAVNIALPSVNPDVRVAGVTTFGNVAATNFLNDGVNGGSTGSSIFQVPFSTTPGIPPGSRGFGYHLGGAATIESIDLSQFTGESPLGPRRRVADAAIHTAAGVFYTYFDDADDVHYDFAEAVVTSWLIVEPLSQHGGGDPQVGIDELAVNSASGTLSVRRENVARGKTYTLRGPGWNNVRGNLTDNVLAGSNGDLSSAAFNNSASSPANSIDVDLGGDFTVDGLGLAEHDYGGAGGRRLLEIVQLEFSDDPNFATVNATRELTLANIPYQQLDFDAATGRYVRLSGITQHPNPDSNLGFVELQLFGTAVPEPGTLGLAALCLPLLLRRRR